MFEEGAIFTPEEEDTVYKILTSDNRDVTLSKMETLVYSLEQDLFQAMGQLNKVEKREEELIIGGAGGKGSLVDWHSLKNDSFDKIVSDDGQSTNSNLIGNGDYGKDSISEQKLHTADLEASLSKAISTISDACAKMSVVRSAIGDYILK